MARDIFGTRIFNTNVFEAAELDEFYCQLRLEKDPCLGNNFFQWCIDREYNFVDYANYGGAGLGMRRENHWNCEGYSYMEITLSSKYPFPNESDYDVVKSRSGLPLWVIEPPDSWDDPEDELEKDTLKDTK